MKKAVKSKDPRKKPIVAALKAKSGGRRVTNVTQIGEHTFAGDCMTLTTNSWGRHWQGLGRFEVELRLGADGQLLPEPAAIPVEDHTADAEPDTGDRSGLVEACADSLSREVLVSLLDTLAETCADVQDTPIPAWHAALLLVSLTKDEGVAEQVLADVRSALALGGN